MNAHRDQRLAADFALLRGLAGASTLFSFEHSGSPPDKYTLVFRGQGLVRAPADNSESAWRAAAADEHRCELRLPYSYPTRPPDIRWRTPLFHPNVSYGGFIHLGDVGLPWEESLGLDVVCERLWNVARLAYWNPDRAYNHTARRWLLDQADRGRLPVDGRPLRDEALPSPSNIIRYERRGVPAARGAPSADVLYIDEHTAPPRAERAASDSGILYID